MLEVSLISIMKLYALLIKYEQRISFEFARDFIVIMLQRELKIADFSRYLDVFTQDYSSKNNNQETKSKNRIKELCNQITSELPKKQRLIVYLYLLKFSKYFGKSSVKTINNEIELYKIVNEIGIYFKINQKEGKSLRAFVNNELHTIADKQNLILIGNKVPMNEINHLEKSQLSGILVFYYIRSLHQFIFYLQGRDDLKLNNISIIPYSLYFFIKSSVVRNEENFVLYYNDLLKVLLQKTDNPKYSLIAKNIEFKYKNSDSGIHEINFYAESGQFIGILGKSGAGKTTLMQLLSGKLKPKKGIIRLNDIQYQNNELFIKQNIGYMPQTDALISELTVYQNLYFYTKLWKNTLSKTQINKRIEELLIELELERLRNRVIGTENDKFLSGGERKRVNLALELIRKPKVLFADEPTSGLSSSDAETIINILHEQVLKGCLVIINIHQPSSEIFATFDKVLILDIGGYPVCYENPSTAANTLNNFQDELIQDTNEGIENKKTNSETIFQILEQKKINEFGEYIHERKISPQEWYQYFQETSSNTSESISYLKSGVKQHNEKQNLRIQFLTYLERNLLIKKSDRQYIFVSLLTAPILAVIIALLSRKNEIDSLGYNYMDNPNIPSFIFMSVIVAIFTGLLTSAEEIFKDRAIISRESLLVTSVNSYLVSKIVMLFSLSGIQMLLYVLVSSSILEIEGMTFKYWLVFWSLTAGANLMGLLLSTSFRSAVTIYIFIPLILIPQILLSGVVIRYNDINPSLSSAKYTPLMADIMPARWAYEAIAVNQFKHNRYQKNIFNTEREISNYAYLAYYLSPDLINEINFLKTKLSKDSAINQNEINLILNGISKFNAQGNFNIPVNTESNFDFYKMLVNLESELKDSSSVLKKKIAALQKRKNSLLESKKADPENYAKEKYFNSALADLLLNVHEMKTHLKIDGEYIRLSEPIYSLPESRFGRAQFYASAKYFGNYEIDSFLFNIATIWLMNLILYITLVVLFTRSKKVYQGYKISKL